MTLQSQKIALHPNKSQQKAFDEHCAYAVLAYNAAHSDFKTGLDAGEWHCVYALKRIFNARKGAVFPEYKTCSQHAAKNAIHNFGDAVNRWKTRQNRFPKRKRRNSRPSFQIDNGVDSVKVTDTYVILPKIGKVRIHEKPRWTGQVRRAVVSRAAHRWYISILVEVDDDPPDTTGLPVRGVDVGINKLATLDDGKTFENPRALKVNERKLRRCNKLLSRKVKGSNNWRKAKRELSRLHARIANIRADAHHKASNAILGGISRLGIESLSVKGLMRNRRISKALADASLSGFLTKLKYKAVRKGVRIVAADRFFPSSKRCSSCGHKDKSLTLSDRQYHCGVCGFQADRDVNAALNLKQLASSWDESLNACGESVRPTLVGWTRGSKKVSTQQIIADFAI
jgi:putative transposase